MKTAFAGAIYCKTNDCCIAISIHSSFDCNKTEIDHLIRWFGLLIKMMIRVIITIIMFKDDNENNGNDISSYFGKHNFDGTNFVTTSGELDLIWLLVSSQGCFIELRCNIFPTLWSTNLVNVHIITRVIFANSFYFTICF